MPQRLVLVVDDEPPVRAYIRDVLQRNGYQIIEADRAVHAIELARGVGTAIDLMITDINMPEMDGVALARLMKAEFPFTKVLLVTGFGLDAADDVADLNILRKPFTPADLLAAVRELLAES